MRHPITVAVYPDAATEKMNTRQQQESINYINPDIVLIESSYNASKFRRELPDTTSIALDHPPQFDLQGQSGSQLVSVDSVDGFEACAEKESQQGGIDTTTETFLYTNHLAVNIQLTSLETNLDGRNEYESALQKAGLTGSYTHLTPHAGPKYNTDWGNLTVQGLLPGASESNLGSNRSIATLKLFPDGMITSDLVDIGQFGLEALTSVGSKTAKKLRQNRFTSIGDISNASMSSLQEVSGIGESKSEQIMYSAKSLQENKVYRTSDETLPNTPPVFIDIETDGLTPTMIWLIGVLDAQTGNYMSFLATNPDDKAKAVEAFMMWYSANVENRPIVAYNGHNFDFKYLHKHIHSHCPEYANDWKNAWKFDLYWWAVNQNNALLPGETDSIETVSEALGWDSDTTGLTGEIVGKLFKQWMNNPCDETELNWESHETYCEDDVRALKYVYDAVKQADAIKTVSRTLTSPNKSSTDDGSKENTMQGTLAEF